MRFLSAAEAHALEPEVACVAACLSPSTGVLDSHALMLALEGHLTAAGGSVVLNTAVTGLAAPATEHEPFRITTESGGETASITANRLVLAGGLSATTLGEMLIYRNGYRAPPTYPARGHYFSLARRAPFKHLVYPMPQGAWLGVHLTLDTSGRAKFGPDIEWCANVSYAFHDPNGERRARFEREVRRYWPGLPEGALQPDYVGVRPKLYREGEPVADFRIDGPQQHGIARLVALYGIESPGLTSSLALGELVASML
jgi:L-2-hydroxyglutarate oxidase LhgO